MALRKIRLTHREAQRVCDAIMRWTFSAKPMSVDDLESSIWYFESVMLKSKKTKKADLRSLVQHLLGHIAASYHHFNSGGYMCIYCGATIGSGREIVPCPNAPSDQPRKAAT